MTTSNEKRRSATAHTRENVYDVADRTGWPELYRTSHGPGLFSEP
ncbi:MAG TPA: hypothetical protein VFQ61_10295 [Polyangiaceae bacterium]|nr:hypothetical protein [Polyangiaceae bacterium]